MLKAAVQLGSPKAPISPTQSGCGSCACAEGVVVIPGASTAASNAISAANVVTCRGFRMGFAICRGAQRFLRRAVSFTEPFRTSNHRSEMYADFVYFARRGECDLPFGRRTRAERHRARHAPGCGAMMRW